MIVVLGHTGFIGRELCRRLNDSGCKVTVFSSEQCDLLDQDAVLSCLGNLQDPYDLVNCAVINRSSGNNFEGLQRNLLMSGNILEAISSGNCRSFIQLSSVDVYGHGPALPIDENSPTSPETYYALAKLNSELLLGILLAEDFPASVLRLPGVYGPGDGGQSLIGKLLRKTVDREPVELVNGGTVLRDYVLIDDLCRVIRMLLDEPRQMMVNLVTGQSRSLREIVEIIFEKTGTRTSLLFPKQSPASADDLVFDNSRFRKHFPGFDFTGLAEGIETYADEYRSTAVSNEFVWHK